MKRHLKSPPKPARCKTTGKARYRDRKTALAVVGNAAHLRAIAERDGVTTVRQERRVYKCDHCGGWHTTSKPLATRPATPTTAAAAAAAAEMVSPIPPPTAVPTPGTLPRPKFVSAPDPVTVPTESASPVRPTPNSLPRPTSR